MEVIEELESIIKQFASLMVDVRLANLPSPICHDGSADLFEEEVIVNDGEMCKFPTIHQINAPFALMKQGYRIIVTNIAQLQQNTYHIDQAFKQKASHLCVSLACIHLLMNEPVKALSLLCHGFQWTNDKDKMRKRSIIVSILSMSSILGLWNILEYFLAHPSVIKLKSNNSRLNTYDIMIQTSQILVDMRKGEIECSIKKINDLVSVWDSKSERSVPIYRAQAIFRTLSAYSPANSANPKDCGARVELLEEGCHKWRTIVRTHFGLGDLTECRNVLEMPDLLDNNALYSHLQMCTDLYNFLHCSSQLAVMYENASLIKEATQNYREALMFSRKLASFPWCVHFLNRLLQLDFTQGLAESKYTKILDLCLDKQLKVDYKFGQEKHCMLHSGVECTCALSSMDCMTFWQAYSAAITLDLWVARDSVTRLRSFACNEMFCRLKLLKKLVNFEVDRRVELISKIMQCKRFSVKQPQFVTAILDTNFSYILGFMPPMKAMCNIATTALQTSHPTDSPIIYSTPYFRVYFQFCLRMANLLLQNPKIFSNVTKRTEVCDISISGKLNSMSLNNKTTSRLGAGKRNLNLNQDENREISEGSSVNYEDLTNETVNWLKTTFKMYYDQLWYPLRRQMAEILAFFEHQKHNYWATAWYLSETNEVSVRLRSHLLSSEKRRLKLAITSDFPAAQFASADKFKQAIENIPADLTITMLISNVQCSFLPPKFFCVVMSHNCFPIVLSLTFKTGFLDDMNKLLSNMEETFTATDKKVFWATRRDIDIGIKTLMESIENETFGALRYCLLGRITQPEPKKISGKWNQQITQLLQYVMDTCGDANVRSLWQNLVKQLPCVSVVSVEQVKKMHLKMQPEEVEMRASVVLVVSQELQHFPWECMPIYSENGVQPISRMHSVHMIIRHNTWEGLVQCKPSDKHLVNALENKDLYLYCGHGSGTRYVSTSSVRHCKGNAVALLMGCNTANIRHKGTLFETRATLHEYTLCASPCVIGCLWTMSDRDMDRYLLGLLSEWISSEPCTKRIEVDQREYKMRRKLMGIKLDFDDETLNEDALKHLLIARNSSRKYCRLPYLTGGAVVAYGLPIVSNH